jgi:CheY-like chemotaxis protein
VPNSASDGNSAGRKLVLVVDDHPPAREALSALLDSEGYHVLEAGNGLEALELIDAVAELPCMIVLDLGYAGDARPGIFEGACAGSNS